jgi:hypothetical protein
MQLSSNLRNLQQCLQQLSPMQHKQTSLRQHSKEVLIKIEAMEEEEMVVEEEPILVEAEDLVEEEVNHKNIAMLMVIMIYIRPVNAEPCIEILQITLTRIGELSILLLGEFNDRKAV